MFLSLGIPNKKYLHIMGAYQVTGCLFINFFECVHFSLFKLLIIEFPWLDNAEYAISRKSIEFLNARLQSIGVLPKLLNELFGCV